MNKPTKIAKEAGITLFGESYGGFTRFLFLGLLSRWVGPRLLGLYALANAVTRITSVVATFGLDRGILRFVSYYRGKQDQDRVLSAVATAIKIGLFSALAMMFLQMSLSGLLTKYVFHADPWLRLLIIFFSLSLPLGVAVNIMSYATQGYKLLKYKVAVTLIIQPTALLAGLGICYLFFPQKLGLFVPELFAVTVGVGFIWKFLKDLTGFTSADILPVPVDKELLKFSAPLMFMTIISTLMHWIDIIMLGIFLDSASVGLYHPAVRTMGIIRMFMLSFNGIFSPMISELYAKDDFEEMGKLFKLVFRWIFTFALPFVIVLVLYPAKIMLLFGPGFVAGKEVIRILAVAMLVQSITGIGGSLLVMIGRTTLNLYNIMAAASVNIILNVILIPRMGLIGAAWGTVGAMLLLALIRLIECKVIVNLHPFQTKLMKPLLAGISTFLVAYFMKPLIEPWHTVLTLTTVMIVAGLVYGAVIYALKLDDDDLQVIRAMSQLIKRK